MPSQPTFADPRIAEAQALFQRAASTPSTGYRLIYLATPGCGSLHNYDNLIAAQRLLPVEYVNWGHPGQILNEKDRKGRLPPGHSHSFEVSTFFRMTHDQRTIESTLGHMTTAYLNQIKLDLIDVQKAVLVDPNGHTVHKFNSTQGDGFIAELKRYLPQGQQQNRGVQRL